MNFAIIGAGFTGAILAHELAKAGHNIQVYESRNHIGGNCYSERDSKTGILVHKYGPHIFHTNNETVWNYVTRLSEFVPYVNRVKTTSRNQVFSLPINLHTINQFFNRTLTPKQAKDFIHSLSNDKIKEPITFEEQALKFIGKELYETFFEGYTIKQWGVSPKDLPASILKRLPVRFSYDDNYFNHKYQGMPKHGYTPIFEKLLDIDGVIVHLNKSFTKNKVNSFDHVFYTGPIDSWFDYDDGKLGYRTLDFEKEYHKGDYQGCAVMNYGDLSTPYTRITEHKHFAPWEEHSDTVIFKEFSRECLDNDIPYYPIRLVNEKKILKKYIERAKKEKKVSFLGRLGTYRYLDMDVTIAEALEAVNEIKNNTQKGKELPSFFTNPL